MRVFKKYKFVKYLDGALVIIAAVAVLFLFLNHSEKQGTPLMDWFINHFFTETGSENAVTAVYLNFRVFDVIFEAMMLLVCVMEVINLSSRNKHIKENKLHSKREIDFPKGSKFLIMPFRWSFPAAVLLGLYFMMNGHLSPGGGFQGGAILTTALLSHYIVRPKLEFNLDKLEKFEQVIFMFIIIVPALYIFMDIFPIETILTNRIYLVVLNTLIGLKVFAGLTIIFNWFVFYEGADGEKLKRDAHEKEEEG